MKKMGVSLCLLFYFLFRLKHFYYLKKVFIISYTSLRGSLKKLKINLKNPCSGI